MRYSDEIREAAHTQLDVIFFEPLHSPASFIVQLYPYGASRIINGKQVPITLHKLLEQQLCANKSSFDAKYRYFITVRKKQLVKYESNFFKSYNKVMQDFHISEAPYIIEITIEEVAKNAENEDVIGNCIATLTTSLVRSEHDIAYDIATLIQDRTR